MVESSACISVAVIAQPVIRARCGTCVAGSVRAGEPAPAALADIASDASWSFSPHPWWADSKRRGRPPGGAWSVLLLRLIMRKTNGSGPLVLACPLPDSGGQRLRTDAVEQNGRVPPMANGHFLTRRGLVA